MNHFARLSLIVIVALCFCTKSKGGEPFPADAAELSLKKSDWPWWRGPQRNGIAVDETEPPWEWTKSNQVWKARIPGRGHACPTIVGDRVFLPTADEENEVQSVICLSRATGKQLWKYDVFKGGLDRGGHKKASQASATIACDGKRIFVCFLNNKTVSTIALDMAGNELWRTPISSFVTHQGFGASPAIYGPLVIVSSDNKGGGAIAGLQRESGKIVWKIPRPKLPNYTSPVILKIHGKDQLLVSGCELVTSLDPLTGKTNWETPGATTECVTSMVTDGSRVFVSGGYPKNHVQAIEADGSKRVAWSNNTRVYVPSMIVRDQHIFGVTDAGVATCWNSETGKVRWKQRIPGTYSASPILVGNKLLAINERGVAYILKVTPTAGELVAKHELNAQVMSSPVICGGRIYLRIAEMQDGKRQESLLCIGN